LRKNLELNDLPHDAVAVSYLKWGSFDTATNLAEDAQCDLLVGSDIIYNAYILGPLA